MGGHLSILWFFFNLPHIKTNASPIGCPPHLKMNLKPPPPPPPQKKRKTEKQIPPLESIAPFHKFQKKIQKWRIPQGHYFFTWSIQNFVRKVKLFVKKYYVAWLFDLANKLWPRKNIDFILCHLLLVKNWNKFQ